MKRGCPRLRHHIWINKTTILYLNYKLCHKWVLFPNQSTCYTQTGSEFYLFLTFAVTQALHTAKPDTKWLMEINEFSIPAGRVCLLAIVYCHDGSIVSWNMSKSPSAELANLTLGMASKHLTECLSSVLHSDRSCNYRWPGWIEWLFHANNTVCPRQWYRQYTFGYQWYTFEYRHEA